MSHDASWNLHLSPRQDVAARWLQEEEGLLGHGIVQLLHMVGVVASYRDNLAQP